MPKRKKGGVVRKITHYCYLRDLVKLIRHRRLIYENIEKGLPTSPTLLKNYFQLLDAPDIEPPSKGEWRKIRFELDKKKAAIHQFFKENDHYNFSIPRTQEQEQETKIPELGIWLLKDAPVFRYSMTDFIENLFAFFKEDMTFFSKTEHKHTLMPFVFKHLNQYLEDAKNNNIVTKYSICVITGAVVAKFGFLMSESEQAKRPHKSKKQSYTEYLYDSVKQLLKKK